MNFSPFPIITTDRLVLRQLSMDDDKTIFVLRSDAEVNRYLNRELAKTIEDARDFIDKVNQRIKDNIAIYWAIEMAGANNLVGTICLFGFSDPMSKCEIGYELVPDFQGQGIMHEAVAKIIEFGIQVIGLQEIEACIHKDNQGSLKLIEKLHFNKSAEPDATNPNCFIFTLKAAN